MQAAIDGRPSPEPEVWLMALCTTFHCTPSQILAEDAALLARMMTYSNAYSAVGRVRNLKGRDIHGIDAGTSRIIDALMQAGVYQGGLDG